MKSLIYCVFAMLVWVFSQTAAAIEVSIRTSAEPSQVGISAKARMGVEGKASSNFTSTLTVAAGATLECEGSTLSPINIQRPRNVSYPLPGYTEVNVLAPESGEGQYEIAGFNSWEPGVQHLCNMQMKGSAVESAATLSGSGYFF